ncbi:phosphoribosyltransferase-like protein [Candidatus Poriferisodalis sp.]|uniref:phosphoribosyltransferase-like protein n=1 Tax=Candidatus Poriferisodalis sp. TaxID=3101277 RepID=UPI003B527981
MKDQLLEKLLARVLNWEAADVANRGGEYQAMARLKFDEYGGYRAGEGFLENLTGWLGQMSTEDRQRAAEFVRDEMVFISTAELDHLIETAYPDVIRPTLLRTAAARLGCQPWELARIKASDEFMKLHRQTLILGLGDGAHIDQLRRTSEFSNEQFYIAPEMAESSAERMRDDLRKALDDEAALFEHVVLVDDFSASGVTMMRPKDGGSFTGRLVKAKEQLDRLTDVAVVAEPNVSVLLYCASETALDHINQLLGQVGWSWQLKAIQVLPSSLRVEDSVLLEMCEKYFDNRLLDQLGAHIDVAGDDIRHGFGGGRLPVVLSHNAPNNSISLLWADTRHLGGSQRGLFPRRHRHNAERP